MCLKLSGHSGDLPWKGAELIGQFYVYIYTMCCFLSRGCESFIFDWFSLFFWMVFLDFKGVHHFFHCVHRFFPWFSSLFHCFHGFSMIFIDLSFDVLCFQCFPWFSSIFSCASSIFPWFLLLKNPWKHDQKAIISIHSMELSNYKQSQIRWHNLWVVSPTRPSADFILVVLPWTMDVSCRWGPGMSQNCQPRKRMLSYGLDTGTSHTPTDWDSQ